MTTSPHALRRAPLRVTSTAVLALVLSLAPAAEPSAAARSALAQVDPDGGPTIGIGTKLSADGGMLVLSIDPSDRTIQMTPLRLDADGGGWTSTGRLRPVRVTDTRPGARGWTVTARIFPLDGGAHRIEPSAFGWAPSVHERSPGVQADAGRPVPPGTNGDQGLAGTPTLATAPPGSGRGTALLGARLDLEVPIDQPAGAYRTTITFTVI